VLHCSSALYCLQHDKNLTEFQKMDLFGTMFSDFNNYNQLEDDIRCTFISFGCFCIGFWILMQCPLNLQTTQNKQHQLLLCVSLQIGIWTLNYEQWKKNNGKKKLVNQSSNSTSLSALKKTTTNKLRTWWNNHPHQGQEGHEHIVASNKIYPWD
jgi:hypothetical protein